MKILNIIILFLSLSLSVFGQAISKEYNNLKLLDLDEMNQMMVDCVKNSRKTQKPDSELMKGLTLLMSRPDEDGLRRKILPTIKGEIDAVIGWREALVRLANDSVHELKKTPLDKAAIQVTHLVILENVLSEIKPTLNTNEDYLKIAQNIANAKIEISDEARNERSMTVMTKNKSPSEVAQELLKNVSKK